MHNSSQSYHVGIEILRSKGIQRALQPLNRTMLELKCQLREPPVLFDVISQSYHVGIEMHTLPAVAHPA